MARAAVAALAICVVAALLPGQAAADARYSSVITSVTPPVKDTGKRAKIFDYAVPLVVGTTPAKVTGVLWWVGDGGGAPGWAIPAMVILVLAGVALIVVVRRRRARNEQAQ